MADLMGLGTAGDDPSWIVPATIVDQAAVVGPVTKDRREDLQVLSFLWCLAVHGTQSHAWQVRSGPDPPDRILATGPSSWGVELTELTMQDVRASLSRSRALGRALEEHLRGRAAEFSHLIGRQVSVTLVPEEFAARPDSRELVSLIAERLKEDKGVVGDGFDLSNGLPERIPADAGGLYGEVAGCAVLQVYAGQPNALAVACLEQAEIRRSEALGLLQRRVRDKDRPGNDVLLITCGAPDGLGHVCPLDAFILAFIAELVEQDELRLEPDHLDGVALHRWASHEWLEVYRRPGAHLPWG